MAKVKEKLSITSAYLEEWPSNMPLKASHIIRGRPISTINGHKKFTLSALPSVLVASGLVSQTGPYDALVGGSGFFNDRNMLFDHKGMDVKTLSSQRSKKDGNASPSANGSNVGRDTIHKAQQLMIHALTSDIGLSKLVLKTDPHVNFDEEVARKGEKDQMSSFGRPSCASKWRSSEIIELLYREPTTNDLRRPRASSMSHTDCEKASVPRRASLPRKFKAAVFEKMETDDLNTVPIEDKSYELSIPNRSYATSNSSDLTAIELLKGVLNVGSSSGDSPPLTTAAASPRVSCPDSGPDDSNAGGKLLMSILGIEHESREAITTGHNEIGEVESDIIQPSDNSAGEYLMSILRNGPSKCKTQSVHQYDPEAPCFDPRELQLRDVFDYPKTVPVHLLNVHAEQFMPKSLLIEPTLHETSYGRLSVPLGADIISLSPLHYILDERTYQVDSKEPAWRNILPMNQLMAFARLREHLGKLSVPEQCNAMEIRPATERIRVRAFDDGSSPFGDIAGQEPAHVELLVDMAVLPGASLSDEVFVKTMRSAQNSQMVFPGAYLSNELFLIAMHSESIKASIFPGFRLADCEFHEITNPRWPSLETTTRPPSLPSADESCEKSLKSDRWSPLVEDENSSDECAVDNDLLLNAQDLPTSSIMQHKFFMRESRERSVCTKPLLRPVMRSADLNQEGFVLSHTQHELEKVIPRVSEASAMVRAVRQLSRRPKHNMNFFGDVMSHKSTTAPETSLEIVLSTSKPKMSYMVLQGETAGLLDCCARLWFSWLYFDPMIFGGDYNKSKTVESAFLREEIVRDRSMRFYTQWGEWQVTDPHDEAVDNLDETGLFPSNYTVYNGSEWYSNLPKRAAIEDRIWKTHSTLEKQENAAARHRARNPSKIHMDSPLSAPSSPQLLFTHSDVEKELEYSGLKETKIDKEAQVWTENYFCEQSILIHAPDDVSLEFVSDDEKLSEEDLYSSDEKDGENDPSVSSHEEQYASVSVDAFCREHQEVLPPTSIEVLSKPTSPKQSELPVDPTSNAELKAPETDSLSDRVQTTRFHKDQNASVRTVVQKYYDAENTMTGFLFSKEKSTMAPSFTVFRDINSPLQAKGFRSPPFIYELAKLSDATFKNAIVGVKPLGKLNDIKEGDEFDENDSSLLSAGQSKRMTRLNQEFRALHGLPEPGMTSIRKEFGRGENAGPIMPTTPETLRTHRHRRAIMVQLTPIADADDSKEEASGIVPSNSDQKSVAETRSEQGQIVAMSGISVSRESLQDENTDDSSPHADIEGCNNDIDDGGHNKSILTGAHLASSTRLPTALGLRASPSCSSTPSISNQFRRQSNIENEPRSSAVPGAYPASESSLRDTKNDNKQFGSLRRSLKAFRPFTPLSWAFSYSKSMYARTDSLNGMKDGDANRDPKSQDAKRGKPTTRQAMCDDKTIGSLRTLYNALTTKR